MVYYILLFIPIALMALFQPSHRAWKGWSLWIPTGIFFILFIGLRDKVGGDWLNYLEKFNLEAYGMSYAEAFVHGDPAYWLLQVLSHHMGWGIYGVNVIGTIIFMTGLIIFLRRLENPWLGLTIATAYTILVVVIGYVRQGIALGLIFWALSVLSDRKFIKFTLLIVFATMFHKSAVLILGVGAFIGGKGKLLKLMALGVIMVGVWQAFVSGSEEHFTRVYIDSNMQSSGAYIRVFMNFIPSIIFLLFRKKWKARYSDYTFWYIIALGSIGSLFVVGIATTAVDRIVLYFIPIQIIVFARLPYLLQGKVSIKFTTLLIVLYYGLVYFVWLNFAAHSYAWVHYDNILLWYLDHL